jgi:hypothetical protein
MNHVAWSTGRDVLLTPPSEASGCCSSPGPTPRPRGNPGRSSEQSDSKNVYDVGAIAETPLFGARQRGPRSRARRACADRSIE